MDTPTETTDYDGAATITLFSYNSLLQKTQQGYPYDNLLWASKESRN